MSIARRHKVYVIFAFRYYLFFAAFSFIPRANATQIVTLKAPRSTVARGAFTKKIIPINLKRTKKKKKKSRPQSIIHVVPVKTNH